MSIDIAGSRIKEIMEGKDLEWLDPPHPAWRVEPPNLFRWLFKLGFRVSDYDERFTKLLADVIKTWPGAYVTYARAPEGLSGTWNEAPLDEPSWKEAQTGAYKRALQSEGKAWIIPDDADVSEIAYWLSAGAWSIWKPNKKKTGLPRVLAQATYKTVIEHDFAFLMTSNWDNEFTELSVNPGDAGEAEAAA